MSDVPGKDVATFAPQLLGILILAAILKVCVSSDPLAQKSESPLQQASGRLRVGMTSAEANAITHDLSQLRPAMAGDSYSYTAFYSDPKHGEWLTLSFASNGDLRDEMHLIKWDLHR